MVEFYESKNIEMRFTPHIIFTIVDRIYGYCREETSKFDISVSNLQDHGFTYATGSGRILEIKSETRDQENRSKYATLATLTLSDDNSELVLKINSHRGLMADPEKLVESLKHYKKR